MNLTLIITAALLIPAAISPTAYDSIPDKNISVRQAISENNSGLWQLASLSFANPAINQWRLRTVLTSIGSGYSSRRDRNNPDIRNGSGYHKWQIGASTYTRHLTSTLWGDASYTNGQTSDVVWNETADMEILYPYLLADSVGGNLKHERYRFSGGYADHKGRWAWGMWIGYTTLLQYRDVDPRPRNIVGKLEISAAALFRIAGKYYAGLDLGMMKYKQTNEIEFKSEMGVDKIFHLTGLATHYNRFAGNGLSTYYDGYLFATGLNLYPSDSSGAFATCRLSRFTFNNILSDLNKLPLAHVWHNLMDAETGWLAPGERSFWGAAARIKLYRRHGIENIFGDATSSIYPVIASNEMYADNAVSVSAICRWGMKFGPLSRFHLQISPQWSHRTTAYIEPYSYKVINSGGVCVGASATLQGGRFWMFEASASVTSLFPYSCRLSLVNHDNEMTGLEKAERGAYRLESSKNTDVSLAVGITRMIGRYALTLEGVWSRRNWNCHKSVNYLDIKLNFTF